jgi:putative heme-binding domain-containing protein
MPRGILTRHTTTPAGENSRSRTPLGLLVCLWLTTSSVFAQLPQDDAELLLDYSQWKLAAGSGSLAEPVSIAARPGFAVEVVRAAEKGEGSWISLAFDGRGRLLVGREDKGILRFTLADDAKSVAKVEAINDTLLEPRGLLIAHNSLYVTANNMKGIYRLKNTDDGDYAAPELLQQFEGGVGHGRNGMALGPDGKIYLACGNNVKVPKEWDLSKSPYRNFGVDRLLPCAWNEFLFDSDVTPPAGFVCRCDADGKNWQLIAGGFRNPYDLAFNRDGELFTYDADMEWDVGAPWYRPTTVIHVVPGGEYGWRQGTSLWPDHFPDMLPRVVDVGLGSPTGVAFGETSKFPAPYRDALFILDWAYGRVLAVHLAPKGASYSGKVETFLRGKPLNVTDVVFGPDGAMYFSVGGRGTRSAVYRVAWTGEETGVLSLPDETKREWRDQRRELERLLIGTKVGGGQKIISALKSSDPFIRNTARTAWENEPKWYVKDRIFSTVAFDIALWTAEIRRGDDERSHDERLSHLIQLLPKTRTEAHSVAVLRGIQLSMNRHGRPADEVGLLSELESRFPATKWSENQLLTELLVYLQSPKVAEEVLSLIPVAENDQQRLFYLYALRQAKEGWTIERRREYVKWLKAAGKFQGAHYMPRFLTYIRTDALETFTDEERTALAKEIDQLGRYDEADAPPPRPEIRKWTLDELAAAVGEIKRPVDKERGEKLYAEAQCIRCHRHGERGIPFGPDLQHVAARFGTREILQSIVEPSKVIDDKYHTLTLETSGGLTATGFLVGGNADTFFVASDPLRPTTFQRIPRKEITSRKLSPLSPMPEGALNGLTAEEVYDLLGYLGVK